MFFVFPFILFIIYISETNNFILKKGSIFNIDQNDRDLILQDVSHTKSSVLSTRKSVFHIIKNFTKSHISNPKLNTFDKTLSDEILRKRHIQEKDVPYTSLVFKTSKSMVSSTPELDQKWPIVELLSESDDFKQYVNEFEKKELPLFHDIEIKSKTTEFAQNKQSKDKAVGLRSLPGIHCEDGDQCVCMLPTKTGTPKPTAPKLTTSLPKGINLGFPMGIPMGVPMGFPMGMPAGYPVGIPAGVPAGVPASFPMACPAGIPHSYYQPPIINEVPKPKKSHQPQSNDYLYYDEEEQPERIYIYNEYDINKSAKKRKHDKQHKGDIFIDTENDFEERRGRKPYQNSMSQDKDRPEDSVTDILNDLKKSCDDTVIKNCYCCSAPFYGVNAKVVFSLLILVTFC